MLYQTQEEYDVLGYSLVFLATTMSAVGIVLTKLLANKVNNEDLAESGKTKLNSLSGREGSHSFLPWSRCSHLWHRWIGKLQFAQTMKKTYEIVSKGVWVLL